MVHEQQMLRNFWSDVSPPRRAPVSPIIDSSPPEETRTIFIKNGHRVHSEFKTATIEFVWSIGDLFKVSQVQKIISSPTFLRQPEDGILWKIEAVPGTEIQVDGNKQLLAIWLCPNFEPVVEVEAVSVRGTIHTSRNGCPRPHCPTNSYDLQLSDLTGPVHLSDLNIDQLKPGICLEISLKIVHYLGLEHYDDRWDIGPNLPDRAEFFERVYTERQFTDMKIIVQDVQFEAHKAILATRSPYFKAAFFHDTIEARSDSIELKDFTPEVIECMLKFIYTGEIQLEVKCPEQMREIDIHMASELLRAADMYQVEGLKAAAEHFLHKFINHGGALRVLEVAHYLSCPDLEKRALGYVQRNRDEIFTTPDWETFAQSNPQLMAKFFRSLHLGDD